MTTTPNLSLSKPAAGDASWDVPINANADTLDALFAASGGTHDHSGVAGHGQKLSQANTHQSPDTDVAPTSLHHTLGTGASQAAAGNDSRLSNARTPTAHHATHSTGGTDAIAPADIGAEPALGNPGTDGYVLSSTAAGVRSWTAPGTGGGGGMTNPMTAQDDLIIGGASGAATRLAKGTDGQVLTVDPVTHHLVWATPASGGGGGAPTTAPYVTTAADSTLTAEIAIPGLAGSPDRAGIGGTTFALEFDSTSHGLTASSAPAVLDSNTTIPSHLYIKQTDLVARTFLRAFAPGAGVAFDVRTKLSLTSDATGLGAGLMIADSAGVNIVLIQMGLNNDTNPIVESYQGSGYTPFGSGPNVGLNSLYLRITRDTSNVYKCWWSGDGLGWQRHGTFTLATTVAQVGYRLGAGAAGLQEVFSDFLRAS